MGFLRTIRYGGKKLGEYTIEAVVGEGRFGLCFLAQSDHGTRVIIKKFKPRVLAKNGDKNVYEAVILSKLQDRRIPEFLGVINQRFFYGFILEWKPGVTVKDMLFKHQHVFSKEEFYSIGMQLIDIVKYLHENGIVHRDIRIPNVLIESDRVYLIDFGLARYADSCHYKYDLDYSYLGDFFLYLLYSSFKSIEGRKNLPWYKELLLKEKQRLFLKRLLGLDSTFESIDDVQMDFIEAFK